MQIRNIIIALLVLSASAFAQGGFYQDRAEGRLINGNALVAIPGAAVTVCSDQACVSPVNIYSNADLAIGHLIGTSTTADANGNFSFYVLPGQYFCQIAASGFSTAINPCQVSITLPNAVDTTSNQTITGNKSLTGQNAFTTYSLDTILFVDGLKYPCTAAGTISLLADATGQANAQGCVSGFTSSSEIDIAAGISFLHPSKSTWTFSGTTPAQYGVKLATGSLFSGGSGAASDGAAFTLQASASASLDSLLATDTTVSGGGYFAAENIRLYNPSGGTFANGLLHAENMVDGSFFRNAEVSNYSGIGVNWRKNCCADYTLGLVANGNHAAGAQPFLLNSDSTHINVANYFFSTSLGHPGATKNILSMTGANRSWCHGNVFFGLYMEGPSGNGDTTTPAIDDNCWGVASFFGLTLGNDDASSTRYVLQIESGNVGVNAFGVESGISTNLVNDLDKGVTVTESSAYRPVNYISVPSYFTSLNILGPALKANSKLLVSSNAPTISSGFGTSPSIVNSNGSLAFEINVGTGGVATSGVLAMNSTAANGWSCQITDMNTNIVTRETAFTATSITLTAASAWTASDKLLINCGAF